jgi:hypothetical protein
MIKRLLILIALVSHCLTFKFNGLRFASVKRPGSVAVGDNFVTTNNSNVLIANYQDEMSAFVDYDLEELDMSELEGVKIDVWYEQAGLNVSNVESRVPYSLLGDQGWIDEPKFMFNVSMRLDTVVPVHGALLVDLAACSDAKLCTGVSFVCVFFFFVVSIRNC